MKRTILVVMLIMATMLVVGCKKEQKSSKPLIPSGDNYGRIEFVDEIKTLQAILLKSPDDIGSRTRLGNLLMDADRFVEAVEQYGQVLKVQPNNQNVRVDMGTCYRRMGRSDMAVTVYKKAMEMQPTHANAHLNLGVTYYDDLQKYDLAVIEFEAFIKLEPNSPRRGELESVIAQIRQNIK